jgi:uncharacterized OB-fold protein
MATTKRTEKAVPKMGEIVSFAALKAPRDATRADVFYTIGIISHEVVVGEISVCHMKDGTYMLALVEREDDAGLLYVRSKRAAEVESVGGRVVVTTYLHGESEGA